MLKDCVGTWACYSKTRVSAKILIVDDSGFARRTLRRMLEEQGFVVEEARSGVEALEKYLDSKPDVVFLDVVMEGIQGLEVLGKLRELDADAKVVMATSDVQRATREEALSTGASAYLTKPVDAKELLGVLRRVIPPTES